MMIFFSGPDCSGKDTVMHEVAHLSEYKYYMSPRSPICNIVYDVIFSRNIGLYESNMKTIAGLLSLDAYFVLVVADVEVLVNRAISRGEQHVISEKDFEKHLRIYKDVFEMVSNTYIQYADRFIIADNSGDLEKTAKTLKENLCL